MLMGALNTFETSVNVCQTTLHDIPEDSHLHTHRHENLKSYLQDDLSFSFFFCHTFIGYFSILIHRS
jgi:hypothetical protein